MADFNLNNFLNNLQNYTQNLQNNRALNNQPPPPLEPKLQSRFLQETQLMEKKNALAKSNLPNAQTLLQNANRSSLIENMKMNTIISMDRAVFIKELMNLPNDMKDLMNQVQKMFEQIRQGQQISDKTVNLSQNINLSQLSVLLTQNGKEALSKLMLAMGNASKYGITDLSDIKDTIKVINASVSLAGQNDASKILKSLMLLYLPWVPLQEGVGFDLEIDADNEEQNLDESTLIIFISTKNYGNVKIILNLVPPNEVNVLIYCDRGFPKKALLEKLQSEKHSMKSSVIFEEKTVVKTSTEDKPQAKISVSDNSSINPFLLLMSNLVIRYTIELDNAG